MAKTEKFYDAKFSIEAIQHEPYDSGFTWRSVVGAFFVAFVMLPGIIFMGLMIGQDLGTAADWVTIILFVEVARRSFMTLRKQELYILRYTVSHLSHVAGGMALGGGMFAHLVWNRYMRNSEAFQNFGIAHQVPDWVSPLGKLAYKGFLDEVWLPVILVTLAAMTLSKLTQLALGFLAYKVTADVEGLPFPLAPIHAEGAIALAERSKDENKKNYRQYCFAIGVMIGAVFGLFYVGVPTISMAFLGKPIQLIPIPFLDLTEQFESIMGGGTIGIALHLGILFTGFVLPWRIVVGMFVTTVTVQIFLNPMLQSLGFMPTWQPGKDAIETHVAATVDIYLSVGIGTSLAIALVGIWGIVKATLRYKRKSSEDTSTIDAKAFWRRDVERGDPPTWAALLVWAASAALFVLLSDYLVNRSVPEDEQFPWYWLGLFAFFWTPLNTYINARMSGIAGQQVDVPYIKESFIYLSDYRYVTIWFAPMPLRNFGRMADQLRVCQLTRTRFTSILKSELLVFPLMIFASFIFWSYISSLGPIPSDRYPYVQKFWPQFAQMRAIWASGLSEGSTMLKDAIKPELIIGSLVIASSLFAVFSWLGISVQYLYGGIFSLNRYPHMAVMFFIGACLGRFYFSRRFGRERWQNFAPILAVGFGAGLGLVGMLSIALHFLWVSIGTGY